MSIQDINAEELPHKVISSRVAGATTEAECKCGAKFSDTTNPPAITRVREGRTGPVHETDNVHQHIKEGNAAYAKTVLEQKRSQQSK